MLDRTPRSLSVHKRVTERDIVRSDARDMA